MLHCDRWVNSVNKIALGIQKITKRLWRLSEDVAVVFISLCISQGLHSRLHNVSCKWSKSRCDYRESWLAPEERYSRRSFLKFDGKAKKRHLLGRNGFFSVFDARVVWVSCELWKSAQISLFLCFKHCTMVHIADCIV